MPLSKKKTDELYGLIHKGIVDCRVKIKMLKNPSMEEVDNLLSDLTISLPDKAIDLFKPKK